MPGSHLIKYPRDSQYDHVQSEVKRLAQGPRQTKIIAAERFAQLDAMTKSEEFAALAERFPHASQQIMVELTHSALAARGQGGRLPAGTVLFATSAFVEGGDDLPSLLVPDMNAVVPTGMRRRAHHLPRCTARRSRPSAARISAAAGQRMSAALSSTRGPSRALPIRRRRCSQSCPIASRRGRTTQPRVTRAAAASTRRARTASPSPSRVRAAPMRPSPSYLQAPGSAITSRRGCGVVAERLGV